jgi:hypothetical protein
MIRMFKSRRMRWTWHAARMGETRNAYKILVDWWENQKERRPRRRWVVNIKMDLREIEWDAVD